MVVKVLPERSRQTYLPVLSRVVQRPPVSLTFNLMINAVATVLEGCESSYDSKS
jgi:hypothetical protein